MMRDFNDHANEFAFAGRWVHFIESTYGAWLYGDARGFRTRHHREHIEGDYKHRPPAEAHFAIRRRSLQSLKHKPVRLSKVWQQRVGAWLRERLTEKDVFVLCMAVCLRHVHVLAKLQPGIQPRAVMGGAKKHASHSARGAGWQTKLWARRGKEIFLKDREHQLNVYRYILAHKSQGAWVWDWMQERKK